MYYRGDYYRGDYYQGDPGFFGSLGKFALGVAKLTPVGAAISTGVSLVRQAAQKPQILPRVPSGTGLNPATLSGSAGATVSRTTIGPGGAIFSHTSFAGGIDVNPPGGIGGMAQGTAVGFPRRMHPNKSTYVTRGGGTSRWPRELEIHYRGTEMVPSRRMNVANPRALRRALRRVAGFGKLAKRSRRAVSIAASALGVRHRSAKRPVRR